MGCGPAQPVKFAVLHGPARRENRPIGPCLGRRPGTKHAPARPVRPGGPCRPDHFRAGPARCHARPGRAGPLAIYTRRHTTSSSLSLLLMALLTGAGAGTGSCLLAAVAMVVVVVGVVLGLAFAPGAAAGDCLALGGGGLDARVRAAAGDGDGELPLLLTICCFMLAAGDYLADAIWISLCWRWNGDH